MTNTTETFANGASKLNLRDYAERLAICLGWHWIDDADRGPTDVQILTKGPTDGHLSSRETEPTLHVRQDWRKGNRVMISGTWPVGPSGIMLPGGHVSDQKRWEATYAPDREPAAVARDLGKRMLPGYLADHERAMVRVRDEIAYHADGERVARALGERFANGLDEMNGKARRDFYVSDSSGAGVGNVQVSGESVRIELTGLDQATAEKILALVTGR